MINLFDSFFVTLRNKFGDIVYPFHTAFMTKEEVDSEFEATYDEVDEPFDNFTHYGVFKSKASQRIFAMPMTKDQVNKQKSI
jgi:hypothetical protein